MTRSALTLACAALLAAGCLDQPTATPAESDLADLRLVAVGPTDLGTLPAGQWIGPAVRVTTADGVPVEGIRIRFAMTGSFLPSDSLTDADGYASVTDWRLGPELGRAGVRAYASPATTPGYVDFTVNVTYSPAATLRLSPDTLRVAVGDSIRAQLTIQEYFGGLGPQPIASDSVRLFGPAVASVVSETYVRGDAEGVAFLRVYVGDRMVESAVVVGDATYQRFRASIPGSASAVAVRPGGGVLGAASGGGGTLISVDAATRIGTILAEFPGDTIQDIAIAPSDTLAVYGAALGARIFDPRTGASIRNLPTGSAINRVAFAADGETVLLLGQRIWRYRFAVDSLEELNLIPSNLDLLAAHPTLPVAYAAGEQGGTVVIIDLDTWTVTTQASGLDVLSALRVSPDGTRLYGVSRFVPMRVLDATSLALIAVGGTSSRGTDISITDDGSLIAVSNVVDSRLTMLDAPTLLPLHRYNAGVTRIRWLPGSRVLVGASLSLGILIWE